MVDEVSPETTPKGKPPFNFSSNVSMLEAALTYARYGWPVFPCWPKDKKPATAPGFYDATLDLERIKRFWQTYPLHLIATPTGARTGIFCVDLDCKDGKDGVADWTQLVAEHGEPPPTLSSTTASGGRHLIFQHHDGLRCHVGKLAPGIDIKAEGGCIILPPSFRVFSKNGPGASYKWNTPLIPPAEAPDWLVTKIIALQNRAHDQRPLEEQPTVPYERIKAALSVIDPDIGRDDWIKIGCALSTQLGDDGFELWNGWSKGGQKYDEREMPKQWDSIVKGRYPITIATLFYHADRAQPDWRKAEPNQPGHVDDGGQHERQNLIQSSGDFVANFVPPDYLIDGLIQ